MTARLRWLKTCVFILCALPMAYLVWQFSHDRLGANPIEVLIRSLGEWALLGLLLTLLMTPLRDALTRPWPIQLRRMLGLYTFTYAVLHVLGYVWLEQFFDWSEIAADIVKRPFITVGMLAFILLIPLAFTSTQTMQRRLGRQWRRLHRLIYVIAILGVLHFFWLVKADFSRPIILAGLLTILLGYRVIRSTAMKRSPDG